MDPLIASGHPAPTFQLSDLEGSPHRLEDYRGKIVVLNFWSAECPHAARADRELASYLEVWGDAVTLLSIASNANEPVELLRRAADAHGLKRVLHDPQHEVADLFEAATTPHVFVIDGQGILRYRGAFDDMTFRQRTPTRFYLRDAVEVLLAGGTPDPEETIPYGCTIVRFFA